MAEPEKLVTEQLARHDECMTEYNTRFRVDHQTIASYCLPNVSDINTTKTESIAAWTQNLYDTTATESAQVLSTGMFNWMTPTNQAWAEYAPPEELKQDDTEETVDSPEDDAAIWLGKASDAAMRELGRSNFYPVKAEGDTGLSVFNTDVILVDESDSGNELFNFIHCKISTYSIEENYKGIVDTLRRELMMTYRQIKQKFVLPGDVCPPQLEEQAKKDAGRKFKILHCIFPREDSERLPQAKDGKNKPIASVYISVDFKAVIRVGGYDENPILCRRMAKWGTGAVWGYGPSYLALPLARQLNYVQQYLDALAELHAYPRIRTPDNLDGDVDLQAGGETIYDSSTPDSKPEEWATAGEYKLGLEMQEQRRQQVRSIFFVDAFKLLNSAPLLDKEMTAYEISQRQAEQLQGVAPAITRAIPEFINPLMQRVFGIMFRAGKLRNPPEALMQPVGQNKQALVMPEVVVTSRFNDALRALKNRGAEQGLAFLLQQAEVKPENWDVVNWDKMNRDYFSNAGAPADSTLPDQTVAKLRQQRAQIMAQERALAGAEQISNVAKNLGSAQKGQAA